MTCSLSQTWFRVNGAYAYVIYHESHKTGRISSQKYVEKWGESETPDALCARGCVETLCLTCLAHRCSHEAHDAPGSRWVQGRGDHEC